MNKNQGTTLSAILLAALVFRSTNPGVPAFHSSTEKPSIESKLQGQPTSGDGPWIASCEYWAPERSAPHTSPDVPLVSVDLNGHDGGLKGTLNSVQNDQTDCTEEPTDWGIPTLVPSAGPGVEPKIIAIIATVPDPVQTHMALRFDRTIDALIDAAEDNNYVSSYYWLPWQQTQSTPVDHTDTANANRSTEVREPGLIIFKPVNAGRSPTDDDFRSSLYLFLVGETPTSGINGYQMERAFRYEDDLRNMKVDFSASTKNVPNQLAIIGPSYSGSAASLRRASEFELSSFPYILSVDVRGVTSTRVAVSQMDHDPPSSLKATPPELCFGQHRKICYASFDRDTQYNQETLNILISKSSISNNRFALLIEDDTTFGEGSLGGEFVKPLKEPEARSDLSNISFFIRYPREISLLRNAQSEQPTANTTPSPYLHLSLKGSNSYDSVPHFSGDLAPLSQEAQLMAIQHQLQRNRVDYIVITATDVLDTLFLAQFLHRAIPDAHLVFDDGDLLFEREIDDVPFVGAVTINPYHLIGLANSVIPGYGGRAFPDSSTEAYYNAARYTLWDKSSPSTLNLAGYQNILSSPRTGVKPPLWVTVIGKDGYYPLGIASSNSSGIPQILPEIERQNSPPRHSTKLPIHPSLAWYFLCLLIFLLCAAHTVLLCAADYWSPFTRDLDIAQNDQPHRRSMYINIGTIVLFCMTFVIAWPLIPCLKIIEFDWASFIAGGLTFLAGTVVLIMTLRKTWPYKFSPGTLKDHFYYNSFNVLAVCTGLTLVGLWIGISFTGWTGETRSFVGLFFAYRCLNPTSGVSPVVAMLLLLFSWYLWAVFQNLRLRFSECNRPILPGDIDYDTPYPLYVSDVQLSMCESFRHSCLYSNITCLLITREAVERFFPRKHKKKVDYCLMAFYIVLFLLSVFWLYVRSVDRIVWQSKWFPTSYEFLITGLFFPLLVIAVAGWLRMVFIWGSLKRHLLQDLENLPIRGAFDRIQNSGWISMFRQSGVREQWRDMARSTESMRQLVHDPELLNYSYCPPQKFELFPDRNPLLLIYEKLNAEIAVLLGHVNGVENPSTTPDPAPCDPSGELGSPPARDGINRMHAIELLYAQFAQELLKTVLLPYWTRYRTGLVESEEAGAYRAKGVPDPPHIPTQPAPCNDDPHHIRIAEEFLVIRYISLIRAVLVNLRYLMVFISATFVIATVAWNSYPFQPRQVIDWIFTILLIFLGCGVVGVFAQMYRDPILSRITHTTPNELGMEFYVRIASFGAVPVLTWFAYNYPEIGSTVFKLFQPAVEVMK